jgi:hypothetical protein
MIADASVGQLDSTSQALEFLANKSRRLAIWKKLGES